MQIGFIGRVGVTDDRAKAIRAAYPFSTIEQVAETNGSLHSTWSPAEPVLGLIDRSDTIFLALPPPSVVKAAGIALRNGKNVFVERPDGIPLLDWHGLVKLAEEAGAEVGVARPLRLAEPIRSQIENRQTPSLVLMQAHVAASGMPAWVSMVSDLVDLSATLVGTHAEKRVDCEGVRDASGQPLALAASIRFMTGALVQVTVRAASADRIAVQVVGSSNILEAVFPNENERDCSIATSNVTGCDAFENGPYYRVQETVAATLDFLEAIRTGYAVPSSGADCLQTRRLADLIISRMR